MKCASSRWALLRKTHFATLGRYYEKPFTFANLTIGCLTMKDPYINLKSKTNVNLNWSVHCHVVSISVIMYQNRQTHFFHPHKTLIISIMSHLIPISLIQDW